jgi:predicted membrane channel-forming protein YqfA (hemolysin III family)
MRSITTTTTAVTRGPESWAYIYVAFGFVLAIEGTIIQMLTPLHFPWNLFVYIALGAFTFWLFIHNAWFQNKLIGFKNRYEGKAR